MVMLISNLISMTFVEVRGVQRGGWVGVGLGGGTGAWGFSRGLFLLFIGFQSLSAGG
jgi:hypothetical protein